MDLGRTLTDRLHNWARHVRDPWGAEPHGRCGSIEGRAIRDVLRGDDEADRRSPSSYPIDHADGELVDRAWRRLELSHRWILKWHYVEWQPSGWVMRRLGRPKTAYRLVLANARSAIKDELDARHCLQVRLTSNSISMIEAGVHMGPSGGPCAPREKDAAA